ncbi:hypothetical protein BV22DRAFT_1052761, partial [Leucogyrophana mollusca]
MENWGSPSPGVYGALTCEGHCEMIEFYQKRLRHHRHGATTGLDRGLKAKVLILGDGDRCRIKYRIFEQPSPPPVAMSFLLGDIWVNIEAQTVSWYDENTWQPWVGNCAKVATMHPIVQGYKLYYIPTSALAVKWHPAQAVSSANKQHTTLKGTSASDAARHIRDPSHWNDRGTESLKRKRGDECDEGLLSLTDLMQGDNFAFDMHHEVDDGHDVGEASHVSVPTDLLLPSAVPTYDHTWRKDSCVRGRRGVEFPEIAQTATWWNGLETVLPFSNAHTVGGPGNDEDLETVQLLMKYGMDATACPPGEEEAPVLVLTRPDLDDPEAICVFLQKIRYALAKGRAVIISDWNVDIGPRLKWCARSLELEFYSLRRVVIWQDATLRAQDRAEINKTCSTAREGTALTDSYWSSHSPDSAAL